MFSAHFHIWMQNYGANANPASWPEFAGPDHPAWRRPRRHRLEKPPCAPAPKAANTATVAHRSNCAKPQHGIATTRHHHGLEKSPPRKGGDSIGYGSARRCFLACVRTFFSTIYDESVSPPQMQGFNQDLVLLSTLKKSGNSIYTCNLRIQPNFFEKSNISRPVRFTLSENLCYRGRTS